MDKKKEKILDGKEEYNFGGVESLEFSEIIEEEEESNLLLKAYALIPAK